MKTYTNSKGEFLPKVICAVVEFEHERLKHYDDRLELKKAFLWDASRIFGNDIDFNFKKWQEIDKGDYDHFYSIFPTCKNSRGQELPEDIQVEIVEERLRQWGKDQAKYIFGFEWIESQKGQGYWIAVNSYDYTPSELPTKSDDTFTQGELVQTSDLKDFEYSENEEYVCIYKGIHIVYNEVEGYIYNPNYIRKIQPTELTLPELIEIAESVKGTKVKLKS